VDFFAYGISVLYYNFRCLFVYNYNSCQFCILPAEIGQVT